MIKLGFRIGFAAISMSASLLSTDDARACGGCFHPEDVPPEQQSLVTSHRMALSISPDVSVLWDQVEYAGSPAEFAWVLPVKPGARIEVASDAWFEALEAATAVRVSAPTIQCITRSTGASTTEPEYYDDDYSYDYHGCQMSPGAVAGCGAEEVGAPQRSTGEVVMLPEVTEVTEVEAAPEPVTVVHQGSAGPYETVTLHSDVPGALTLWLQENGFAIDPDVQPIIDAYSADGFDFIALRLAPEQGIQQMKPVRVIQPGAVTTLPLRMVAAGTGANVGMTLFVIGEGRWTVENFPEVIRPDDINWDFSQQRSDYATQRNLALASNDGSSWITAYAHPGALLSPTTNPTTGAQVQYLTALGPATTVADAFMDQAFANGEADLQCSGIYSALAMSGDVVRDPCPLEDGDCVPVAEGEIDARYFACGPLDDLAVALTGLHPRDVWVTRLESNLPRAALANDLILTPASQLPLSSEIVADSFVNPPCDIATTPARGQADRPRGSGRGAGGAGGPSLMILVAGAALAGMMARRLIRARAHRLAPT